MRACLILIMVAPLSLIAQSHATQKPFHPEVAKVWDDSAMRTLELPRAAHIPVDQLLSDYYYQIPERTIWKTYPVYEPKKEPKGYWKWLQQQEPKEAVQWSHLKTKAEWIKAGSIVFESAKDYDDPVNGFAPVRDPKWYQATGIRTEPNGLVPFYRYVIREKGKVEVNLDSCAECHTRVLPNGRILRGAQGNVPFGKIWAYALRDLDPNKSAKPISTLFFGAPWITPSPIAPLSQGSLGALLSQLQTIPEGVNPRQGSSAMYPIQIPDLIGVKDRIYLDRTGLQQHRSIADMMRYDAINNFIEDYTNYDGFVPANRGAGTKLPDPKTLARNSDQALYALALYIYSLKPPHNPNRFGPLANDGKKIFAREGCPFCHTPPLYTNNKLTPVKGFKVPDEDRHQYQILDIVVGTDPFSSLNTRRGTGYYKVPSLKGVWYRGPFQHNGSIATLEDWFDKRRLSTDYVATGYRGYDKVTQPILGHAFGVELSPEDKKALIAFLRTL